MKSSLKYFLLILIGIGLFIPLFFYVGLNLGRFIGEIVSGGDTFYLILVLALVLIVAVLIIYVTQLYLKKKEKAKTISEEEYMLQPFYDASTTDKKNVLASFALLGLLTLIIVALIVNQYLFFVNSAIFWLFVFIYVVFITLYTILLFQRTREAYKKNIVKLLPILVIFGGITGFLGVFLADLEFTFSYSGMALTAASFGILLVGIRYLLLANRSIFDKKAKAEEELNFASEVQQQFLQDKQIETDSLRGFGMSVPARQVGGDFFCLLTKDENTIVAANGDVSGHSFGAGLIMSMLNTAFEDHVFFDRDFSELFINLNNRLLNQPKRSMFSSLGCVVTDGRSAEHWNAGHMPVFVYNKSDKSLNEIHAKAPALGLSKRSVFSPKKFEVTPGDLILIYSDGVIETRDEKGNVRDLSFFKKLVKEVFEEFESPELTVKTLMEKVVDSDRSDLPEDDMTLLVLEIKKKKPVQ